MADTFPCTAAASEQMDLMNEDELSNSNGLSDWLEAEYIRHRDSILKPDGFIVTPLNALREMTKDYEMNLHFEYNEINVGTSKVYLVELYVGLFTGYGECSRRKMATQLAAADILNQIKEQGIEIPHYGFVPGCRISPMIFEDLLSLCQVIQSEPPMYVRIANYSELVNPPLYTFKCQIGRVIRLGYSDSVVIAKRWAAQKMYEALTGVVLPLENVYHSKLCTALKRYGLKFKPSSIKKELIKAIKKEKKKYESKTNVSQYLVETQSYMESTDAAGAENGAIARIKNETKDKAATDSDFDDELDEVFEGPAPLKLSAQEVADLKERIEKLSIHCFGNSRTVSIRK